MWSHLYKITSAYLHSSQKHIEQDFPNLHLRITWGCLLKQTLRDSNSVDLRWDPRICIFHKLPAEADTVITQTTASSPGTEKSLEWNLPARIYIPAWDIGQLFFNFPLCISFGINHFNNECFIFTRTIKIIVLKKKETLTCLYLTICTKVFSEILFNFFFLWKAELCFIKFMYSQSYKNFSQEATMKETDICYFKKRHTIYFHILPDLN